MLGVHPLSEIVALCRRDPTLKLVREINPLIDGKLYGCEVSPKSNDSLTNWGMEVRGEFKA